MLIIYRVEDSTGHGPHRGEHDSIEHVSATISQHYHDKHHPIPWEDGLRAFRFIHVCGTLSLERLLHWFPEETPKILHRHGFHISVFAVDEEDGEILFGKTQVAFDRSYATLIKTMSFEHACNKLKLAA